MPRIISFSMTKKQAYARTKTVTRRMGWAGLQPGTILQGVEKAQGLRKGEKTVRIGLLRVVSAETEPLQLLIDDPAYGAEECRREGLAHLSPAEFVEFFCRGHRGCEPDSSPMRIEFVWLD